MMSVRLNHRIEPHHAQGSIFQRSEATCMHGGDDG